MFKSVRAVLIVGALSIASPALAANVMTASLEKAVDKPQTYVINGLVWRCLGNACATTSDISTADPKRSCAKLVNTAGKVTAFTSPKGALDGADLSACNG